MRELELALQNEQGETQLLINELEVNHVSTENRLQKAEILRLKEENAGLNTRLKTVDDAKAENDVSLVVM